MTTSGRQATHDRALDWIAASHSSTRATGDGGGENRPSKLKAGDEANYNRQRRADNLPECAQCALISLLVGNGRVRTRRVCRLDVVVCLATKAVGQVLTYFGRLARGVIPCALEHDLIGAEVNKANWLVGRYCKNIAAHSSRRVAFVRYRRGDVLYVWVLNYTAHPTATKAA